MSSLDHFRLMASYNAWMNAKVYDAAERLTADELARDRGAFFGSILGTLNHLAAADLIWFGRLAVHPPFVGRIDLTGLPQPASIRFIVSNDLSELRPIREHIDRLIVGFADGLTEADLGGIFSYRRTDGTPNRKLLSSVLSHIFNHQTHHRGQVTTLLSQAGIDVGVTDLLALIPNID
ncbi:DinB family protein [Pleomorphomonas oryzae]|uniref:DinB family protein n=1 Tax=Pleomorphomonas oryzae TaxID=261934 RepID=UPI00040BAB2D|nr:DinB family protein [Pleomorphomonas oryzae]